MFTIQLTQAQDALWQNDDWRAGFLAALVVTIPGDFVWAEIQDSQGAVLLKAQRQWQVV